LSLLFEKWSGMRKEQLEDSPRQLVYFFPRVKSIDQVTKADDLIRVTMSTLLFEVGIL
jgi:hypothetical protein